MARPDVSWRWPYVDGRQFGYFVRYLPDDMVRVRKGLRQFEIPAKALSVEAG
jgi:hypothetical protein